MSDRKNQTDFSNQVSNFSLVVWGMSLPMAIILVWVNIKLAIFILVISCMALIISTTTDIFIEFRKISDKIDRLPK